MGASQVSARVLVVDDSPTIRKVVATILESHGFTPILADNGETALDMLSEESVDLILTDFVMPQMNGYQFCRELRLDERLRDLPIVLMSAKGDKIRGQFGEQTGALDSITKPFDPLALIAVIEGALSRKDQVRSRSHQEPPTEPGAPPTLDAPPTLEEPVRLVASRPAEPPAALTGDLSFLSVADVLQMVELQRRTGALHVSSGARDVTLYLRDGRIDLATSRGLSSDFLLGRSFIVTQALTRHDLDEYLGSRANSKRLIGDALVQAGLVTEPQVIEALKIQTSELVYHIVGWDSGRFTFVRDETCPEATLAALGLVPGGIVMEGFRRVDEWRMIEGSFDFDEVLHRDPVASGRNEELTQVESAVLELIDGERSVREIVDLAQASTFDVCKTLYRFLNSRLVRRRAA